MDETLFYVAGIILILIALAISAIGMRSDDFPSTGVLRAGVAATALVVVVTAFGAVTLSEAEEEERLAEENEAAALEEEELTAENEVEGAGAPEAPANSGEGPTDAGAAVFVENGCGSCHSLADLGDEALGQVGPNLDEALVDKDPAYIETAIADPSAVVAEGFTDGIMPGDYAEDIAPEDLDALVDYLSQATSGGAGGGASGSDSGSGSGSGSK